MIPIAVSRGIYLAALANVEGSGLFAENGVLFLGCPVPELRRAWETERALIVGVLGFGAPVRRGRPRAACYGPPYAIVAWSSSPMVGVS